jgi:hypothetical protein
MLYVILYFKLRNFVISHKNYCFGHLKKIKTRLNAFFITNKCLN